MGKDDLHLGQNGPTYHAKIELADRQLYIKRFNTWPNFLSGAGL